MNVNIYGAGLSGLTTAFELANKIIKVIYEKNNSIEGMAKKSKYNEDSNRTFLERLRSVLL